MQISPKKDKLHTKTAILINNLHPSYKLPITHKNVRKLISKVIFGEDCKINEIIINFVENKTIKKINNVYLNHNYYTDIITFPYNDKSDQIEGEIFISLDTVKKNAKTYGSGYKMELERVLIHGCLHLTGYLDATNKQKELIRRKENFYLSK